MTKRRLMRAMLAYRQILGVAGLPVLRADGTVKRKGISERVSNRLLQSSPVAVKAEQLRQRVRSMTDGVIIGSREFVDGWFERNRSWFGGASKTERKTGARTIAKGWRGLYNLRELK